MIKLLQIHNEGNAASGGLIADEIGRKAIRRGWDSYIAIGRNIRKSGSKIIVIGNIIDQTIHFILTKLFDIHGFGSVLSTIKLISQIKRIQPDLIHLHSLHGYYINVRILFKYLASANIPVVWTFHDFWPITGHCTYFDNIGCQKWLTECNNCPKKRYYPSSYLLDRSRENYYLKKKLFNSVGNLTIVSVSHWVNNIVRYSFIKNANKKVIYNGIDTDVFKHTAIKEDVLDRYNVRDKFVILSVASPWSGRKGYLDFIKLSKYIKDDEVIILVGVNNEQQNNLPNNIIGLQAIGLKKNDNKQRLVDLYSACDVYMNLSVEETFGLTTTEAMSCGTPVIAYNSTACPEIINSETGIIVEKKDIDALISAIEIIKKRGKAFYSENCRARVLRNFNTVKNMQEYIDLYYELLNK